MNRSELVEKLAAENSLEKAEARKLIDSLVGAIAACAVRGEEVAISGFGKFKVKDTPARPGRNPATGQPFEIEAARRMTFTPASALKDRLNGRS